MLKTNTEWVVADWRAELAAWDRQAGRSGNTLAAHQNDMAVWCQWYEEETGEVFLPENLNGFDLRRFRQWSLEVQGVKPATWNRRLATLRCAAECFRKMGVDVASDLFDGILPAEEQQRPAEWLGGGDFERLGRWLESSAMDPYEDRTAARRVRALRDRAICAVMLYAGLREMEVANLQMADLALTERRGMVTVRRGKGDKRRQVPVADVGLRKILRRWLEARGDGDGYLFPNETGGRLSERSIQELVGKIGERCGVDDLRAHRLRHTFGKRMADAGVALQTIAALMGHSSLEVTRRYVQPGEEDLVEAVELVSLGKHGRKNG